MLTAPWALLSLLAIPIVFGIYFFRTRSKRREVSSLFLWVDRNQAKQGGRRLQTLQLPLLILLEILILALLAVAAARPMVRSELTGRPTAIILDASYSMSAGEGEDTTQNRALDDLHRMLDRQIGFPVQFVLAGAKPQLVAGRAKNAAEAREILKDWVCESESADIDAAVSLTANVSTPGTKILVVTDHVPSSELTEGKVLWKAYGKPAENVAIVHASRTFQDDRDRLLLEIANFSDKETRLQLNIIETKLKKVVFREDKILEPLAVHRIRTGIPKEIENLEIHLADDPLKIDNHLTVLPPSRRPIRVRVENIPAELKSKLEKALDVSGMIRRVEDRPELLFDLSSESIGSANSSTQSSSLWTVRLISQDHSDAVKSFVGPFVIDYQHPIATGLSLDGVVWGGSETLHLPGSPIISAGNVPLLTEQRRRNGSRILTLQLNDRISTLTSGPAWPILVWNILKYRGGQRPGIAVNNLKLGNEAEFIADEADKNLEIIPPDGKARTLALTGSSTRIPADQIGVYQIKSESGESCFSVGTLSTEESNLLAATTETRGNWFDEETLRSDFVPLTWALLLAVLLLLTVHHALVSIRRTEVQTSS